MCSSSPAKTPKSQIAREQYQKKFTYCCKSSRPHIRFPNLGIWQRDWSFPREFDFEGQQDLIAECPKDSGNRDSWMAQIKLCAYKDPGERSLEPIGDLPVFEGLLLRHMSAVAWCWDRDTGSSNPGRCMLAKVLWEVTFSPTKKPVDPRSGSLPAKQLTGREHSPTHRQKIGLKIY